MFGAPAPVRPVTPAELTGETAELPGESIVELEGTFTGTVDGGEVFSTEVLGG